MRSIALLAAALALSACHESGQPLAEQQPQMELHAYDVAPERADELESALAITLQNNDKPRLGSVHRAGPGKLLVLAPRNLQGSIGDSLKSLGSAASPSTAKPAQVRIQYWTVDAVTGPGADDAALTPLTPALDEVRKTIGSTVHFSWRDQMNAVSGSGDTVIRKWGDNDLQYRLRPIPDGVSAAITYGERSLNTTTVPLHFGQFVVLAQNPVMANGANERVTRLYVVRADAATP